MRESRTYGSVRGARDEIRVPTATGVDGPLAASECQTAVIEPAAKGSHPWARLLRSDWTWRSMFFRCTGLMRGSDGSAQAASACAGSGVLQSTAALSGWPG